jgi:methylenetetrahydrofolate reductase (NADPH)
MARITDLIAQGRTVSFEFFPPANDEEARTLEETIAELAPLAPSFVSVTYRGGAKSRALTTQVVVNLHKSQTLTAMPHLTCVAHPRNELQEILETFRSEGLENVLALGGDPLPEGEGSSELTYARELVALARESGFPSIGVAAYPAGHPRSPSLAEDRLHLKAKMELADFAITQFFFRLDDYLRLRDDLAKLGIDKPILPGIMPILSLRSISRMGELAGYPIPKEVVARIEPYENQPEELRKAGLEIATEVCQQVLEAGAPGLHFYTLNRSKATREIYAGLGLSV